MIEVRIGYTGWRRAIPEVAATVRSAADAALAGAGEVDADLTILLADAATLGDLNQRFRAKSGPTNVLAFPAVAAESRALGDIALAFELCVREAQEQGKSLADHLSHLVVHGVLHLIGYDHRRRDEAERMEAKEREILRRLGIGDPYLVD